MKTLAITSALLVVAIIGVLSFSGASPTGNVIGTMSPSTGQTTNQNSVVRGETGSYQTATLKMVNYAYVVEPSPLQVGVPVRMEVDLSSVYGCMRDIVIPAFNVRKYVKEGDNVITFTPDKEGTYNIACSMNMGRGTFVVGKADAFVEKNDAAVTALGAGSCGGAGSSGGGCGCGAR